MASPILPENEINKKLDRCFVDALVKFTGGATLGTMFALLFFKRKRWPIIVGSGFGLGMAYANCERELNAFIRH